MPQYTTDIPYARQLLQEIAGEIRSQYPEQAARIEHICSEYMTRKPSGRRAPTQRRMVTPKIRAAVLEHMHKHPDEPQEAIAQRFNIDGGRVSEIWNSRRGAN